MVVVIHCNRVVDGNYPEDGSWEAGYADSQCLQSGGIPTQIKSILAIAKGMAWRDMLKYAQYDE